MLTAALGVTAGRSARQTSRELLDRHKTLAGVFLHFEKSSDIELPQAVHDRLATLASELHRVLSTFPAVSHAAALAARLRREMQDWPRESFRVLFLDSSNQLLADEVMWEGTVNRVQVHPREVVRRSIETGATALVLAHNHPSGDPAPSRQDVALTNRIVRACEPIDVVVHDHIIVGKSGWFSMAEQGLLVQTEGRLAGCMDH